MLGLYDWAQFHFLRWRYPPRPMTGLGAILTPEQRKRILESKADV
ncbi:hypothetical protein [Methylobacterium sp. CM6246]